MEININKRRVDGVVEVSAKAIVQAIPDANPLEVLVGLSQLVGRLIAAQGGTSILHNDMISLAVQQITGTVRAGYSSEGKNPEGIT